MPWEMGNAGVSVKLEDLIEEEFLQEKKRKIHFGQGSMGKTQSRVGEP
jgi:hypothetical protein